MRSFLALALLLLLGIGSPQPNLPAAQPEQVERGLLPDRLPWWQPQRQARMNLKDRMAFYHVPGVSMAVIDRGKVAWAKGYGVLRAGQAAPVTPTTLFQAASISKAVTATAALQLVQQGKLELDTPVNRALHSWRLPENALTRQHPVTLRELLSHTAGIGVPGYLGYPSGQPLPTLLEVLRGQPPATSLPVRVEQLPGKRYTYSGGGYEVVQLLMQDATATPFPALIESELLGPLGMTRSRFAQPLPAALVAQAAAAHQPDGTPLPGRWHTYPELAAAGLWSTPSDLARWLLALSQSATQGQPAALLSPELTQQMMTNHSPGLAGWGHAYGLGLNLHGRGRSLSFGHSGINQGYRALAVMYPHTGQGVVIMTNGENGLPLYNEILRGVAVAYDWPGNKPQRTGWTWPLLAAFSAGLVWYRSRRPRRQPREHS